jgi:CMP-N-acetylneuraminic acid synthetase
MRVLGVTFARGGSVGVPQKNIRSVGGKPLIAWTLEEAKKCKMLDEYVVSTDDQAIANVALEHGVPVYEEPYSDGTNPLLERILWLLDLLEEAGEEYEALVDIRATNPLKSADDIDACVRKLMSSGADVVCGISKLDDHHPARIKQLVAGDRLVDVWPEPTDGLRQSLKPDVYIRNGSIYACRVSALREGIHFTGGDIRGHIMPLNRSVNVDTELDMLVCEALLTSQS